MRLAQSFYGVHEALYSLKNGMMVGGYYRAIFAPFNPFRINHLERRFSGLSLCNP
jgi:hypothetical protein